jgi:hypothetical protein
MSLRATGASVAIRKITILKPAHLYRRNIFDFARKKLRGAFEVVACNNKSRNARSKTKM